MKLFCQTDLDSNVITEVDKMVIVNSMMSFPTQMDEEELKNMDPIVPCTTKQETTR